MRYSFVTLCLLIAGATMSVSLKAEQRIALVIGNASYAENPLDNPVNDARAVSNRLDQLGFTVHQVLDGSLRQMQQSLLDFSQQIQPGATVMVFYAGHGIQANGKNYLLPVDTRANSERSLKFAAIEMNDVLDELASSGARIKLVVMDACRNNPFEKKFRGGSRGLAVVDAAAGTLIAYATAPGSIASDGDGKNGLYTSALLEALEAPGLKVEEVFKEVRKKVSHASRGQQIPWESSSLTGDFVFNPAQAQTLIDNSRPDQIQTQTEATTSEAEDRCADLSGLWEVEVGKACKDQMLLTRADDNNYDMIYSACGAIAAVTRIRGSGPFTDPDLVIKWKSMPCSGTTVYSMKPGCRQATAQVIDIGGLPGLCNVFADKNARPSLERR